METAARTRYRVEGMDCGACAVKIDKAVRQLPGILDVSVSAASGALTALHDARSDLEPLERAVTGLGYRISRADSPAEPRRGTAADEHRPEPHSHDGDQAASRWRRSPRTLLAAAAGIGLVIAYAVGKLWPAIAPWAFIAAMLIGLIPIARRAFAAARLGAPFSIETLMTIAAVGAVVIGAGEEAATVVFLFLVGELLEGVAAGRARASIQGLAALVPKTALVETDGRTQEARAESVAVGAVVLVRPGDRIPADGVIVAGESAIDEAPVTGESTPKLKRVDDAVFAGTINGDAAIRIRVAAAASDNTIARVVRLVEEAQERKAPTERFIDRFSSFYTPAVAAVAALIAVAPPLLFGSAWDEWIYKGLAILLIGCPCALVISTPAAIAASLSAGARRGLLLKGGAVLENVGRVTAAAFDKTGTLTEGKPKVTDVVGFGRAEPDVLRLAAALETGSSHPLATAILARAEADGVTPPAAEDGWAVGGKGVMGRAEGVSLFLGSAAAAGERAALTAEQLAPIEALNADGKSVAVLVADGKAAGVIAMRDEPRDDAKAGLKALADAGVRTVMLSGDNRRAAEAVGRRLGIAVRAELTPADKQRIVRELKSEGFIVAKIGDGINDAPALAAADVGVAMGSGADVALEMADAALLHGRVGDVAAMIDLSKRTMRNIRENITIALGLKAVFLVTTIAGITGLWPAILADTGATVLVTMNALRLLRARVG